MVVINLNSLFKWKDSCVFNDASKIVPLLDYNHVLLDIKGFILSEFFIIVLILCSWYLIIGVGIKQLDF